MYLLQQGDGDEAAKEMRSVWVSLFPEGPSRSYFRFLVFRLTHEFCSLVGVSRTVYALLHSLTSTRAERSPLVEGVPKVVLEVDPQIHLCTDLGIA
jgi:hypothetical protein